MLDFTGSGWTDLSAAEQLAELDNQWRDVRQDWDRGEMMPDELLSFAALFRGQLEQLAQNDLVARDADSLLNDVDAQVREAEELNDIGLLIRGDGLLLRPGDRVDIEESLSIIYDGQFYTAGQFARLAAQGEFDIEVLIDVTEGEIHVKYGRLEYELRGDVAIREFTVDNDGGDGENDLIVLIEGRLIPDTHIDNPIVEQMTIMWKGEEVNPYDLAQGLVDREIHVDIDPQRDQVTIIYDGGEYILRGQGVVRKFAVDNIDFAGGPELYIVTYEDNFVSAGENEEYYDARRDGVEAGDGDRISLVYDSDLVTFDFLVDEGVDISVDPRAEIVTVKYAGATYTLRGKGAVERFYKDAEDVRGGTADDLVFYVDDAKLQVGDSEQPRDALGVYYKGKELTLEQLAEAEGVTVAIDLDRAEVKVSYSDWSYTLTGDFVVELFGGELDPAKGEIDALIIEVASLYEEWQETEKQWDRSRLTPQEVLSETSANEGRLNEIEATIAADYADYDAWTAPLEDWIDDLRKDMEGEIEEANAALLANEEGGDGPDSGPSVDDLIADVRHLTDDWAEIEVQWDSGELTAAQLLQTADSFEAQLAVIESTAPDDSTLQGMISYLRTDMEGEVDEARDAQEVGDGGPGGDTFVVVADGVEMADPWGKKVKIDDTVTFWLGGSQISTANLIDFADKVKIDKKKNKVKIEIEGEKFELRGSAVVEIFNNPTTEINAPRNVLVIPEFVAGPLTGPDQNHLSIDRAAFTNLESFTMTFKVYELGTWDDEQLTMSINGVDVSLGIFNWRTAESTMDIPQSGEAVGTGITVSREEGTGYQDLRHLHDADDPRGHDQIHTYNVTLTGDAIALILQNAPGEDVEVTFSAVLNSNFKNETFGIADFETIRVVVQEPEPPVDPVNGTWAEENSSLLDNLQLLADIVKNEIEEADMYFAANKSIHNNINYTVIEWNTSKESVIKILAYASSKISAPKLEDYSVDPGTVIKQKIEEAKDNLVALNDALVTGSITSQSDYDAILQTVNSFDFLVAYPELGHNLTEIEEYATFVTHNYALRSMFQYDIDDIIESLIELNITDLGLDDLESLNNDYAQELGDLSEASEKLGSEIANVAANAGLSIPERLTYLTDEQLGEVLIAITEAFSSVSDLGGSGDQLLESLDREIGDSVTEVESLNIGTLFGTIFYMVGGAAYPFGGPEGIANITGTYAYLGGALGHSAGFIENLSQGPSIDGPPAFDLVSLDIEGFTALESFSFFADEADRRIGSEGWVDNDNIRGKLEDSETIAGEAADNLENFIGKAGLVQAISNLTEFSFNQGAREGRGNGAKDIAQSNQLVDMIQEKTKDLDVFFESLGSDTFNFQVEWDTAYAKRMDGGKPKNLDWTGFAEDNILDHSSNTDHQNLFRFQAQISGGVLGDEEILLTWVRDAEDKGEAREQYQEFVLYDLEFI